MRCFVFVRTACAVAAVLLIEACGGGGASSPARPVDGIPSPAGSAPPGLIATSFAIAPPKPGAAIVRAPAYVGTDAQSVTVTLTAVNGGAPPAGLTTSVTTSIVPANCPCTVGGPYVPPGSDSFSFATFDATGNQLATATGTYTVNAGMANSQTAVTLMGIPNRFAFTLPHPNAGATSTTAMTLSVEDADGNPISGTYATPVTLSDGDTNGTQGTQLTVNGGTAGLSQTVTASTDAIKIVYGGLAMLPVTFTASAAGATTGTASFSPTLKPITYTGYLYDSTPELSLYNPTGTGSTASFSVSEAGWSTSPYDQTFTATPSAACATIGTLSATTGTSFTMTAVASPVIGVCTVTITDGVGQSIVIDANYAAAGFYVN